MNDSFLLLGMRKMEYLILKTVFDGQLSNPGSSWNQVNFHIWEKNGNNSPGNYVFYVLLDMEVMFLWGNLIEVLIQNTQSKNTFYWILNTRIQKKLLSL